MEVENDGYGPESSIAQLVAALRARTGVSSMPVAAPVRTRSGSALIYRAQRVTPLGAPATLVAGPFGTRSRAPLAQAFRAGDGPAFVVVANHFKSKGCCRSHRRRRRPA